MDLNEYSRIELEELQHRIFQEQMRRDGAGAAVGVMDRAREANTKSALPSVMAAGGGPSQPPPNPFLSERLTLQNVDDAFRYQPWMPDQHDAGEQVREALVAAAKTILRCVPETPTRTRALNGLVDARMLANAAITHRGRF